MPICSNSLFCFLFQDTNYFFFPVALGRGIAEVIVSTAHFNLWLFQVRQQIFTGRPMISDNNLLSSCNMWKFSSSGELSKSCSCLNLLFMFGVMSYYKSIYSFRYLEPHEARDDELLHPYEKQEAQLPSLLIKELHSLTLHIGHLPELPGYVLGAFTILPQAKVWLFIVLCLVAICKEHSVLCLITCTQIRNHWWSRNWESNSQRDLFMRKWSKELGLYCRAPNAPRLIGSLHPKMKQEGYMYLLSKAQELHFDTPWRTDSGDGCFNLMSADHALKKILL